MDDSYFQSETADAIADNVLALYGAKLVAYVRRTMNGNHLGMITLLCKGETRPRAARR